MLSSRWNGIPFLLILVFSGFHSVSLADDLSWDLNLANPAETPPPAWIRFQPQPDGPQLFSQAEFAITPPANNAGLLLTVSFNEIHGGFLRVFWTSLSGSQTLSENLYEGIDMPNQRSLLIPQTLLTQKGVLTFQSSQQNLNVYHLRWDWLQPQLVGTSATLPFPLPVINQDQTLLPASAISGDPALPANDTWKNDIITAPLTEKPERIEQGAQFQADLQSSPSLARLECKLSGAPLDKPLTLWINGQSCGTLSVETPDLTDPGYQADSTGQSTYMGWRRATAWIPRGFLQAGTNQLQFTWDKASGDTSPVAIKDLTFQLKFPPAPVTPPTSDNTTPPTPVPTP